MPSRLVEPHAPISAVEKPASVPSQGSGQWGLHYANVRLFSKNEPKGDENMDWFEKLVGFREGSYDETRNKLRISENQLISKINGAKFSTGTLKILSLAELRSEARKTNSDGRLKVSQVVGDVRLMHRDRANAGALFQVASQFNLLEMIGPSITPEHGVTRYQNDPTQGPACAIAAGAATIFRNYFVSVGQKFGQSADCQIDTIAKLEKQLASDLGLENQSLWSMQNGYALPNATRLSAITHHLRSLDDAGRDKLRENLEIGIHWNVEATEVCGPERFFVSQAFCSAMPVSYSGISSEFWDPLGCLVLEAAYEATLWAGIINNQRSRIVYLTLLGGGAFGNPEEWIYSALRRALSLVKDRDIDVRIVNFRQSSSKIERIIRDFS